MTHNDRVSPAEVQQYLAGIDYPAMKEDLVNKARQNNAPEEVIRTLEDMEVDEFGGPEDVMNAYADSM